MGAFVAAIVVLLTLVPSAHATTLPTGFSERTLVSGLSSPTSVAWAPDGRMFFNAGGQIKVLPRGSTTPINVVGVPGFIYGMALDKDFATNGFLYALYIRGTNAQLARYTVNAMNTTGPATILLGSVLQTCTAPSNTLDCIPHTSPDHHTIGTVLSDPRDGTLWVGSGDDATPARVDSEAFDSQNPQALTGKILHIDRNGRGLPGHAFCPTDTDLTHNCTKVHSIGHRNPYRFNLRPSDGNPVVGDVGWESREELYIAKKGQNHGWPCYEGSIRTPGYQTDSRCTTLYSRQGTSTGATMPNYEYVRPSTGASITGGPVYTGTGYPSGFQNEILIADYVLGWFKRVRLDSSDRVVSVTDWATNARNAVDLKLHPDNGDLVWVDFAAGAIKRISYQSTGNRAPTARATATPSSGPSPLTVQFRGDTSSDPDGDALTYDWDFGDGSAHSTQANPSHTYTGTTPRTATLRVSDGRGGTDTETVQITPGNNAPTVNITAPATFRIGQNLPITGSATDPEDGTLPASAFDWTVELIHIDHQHLAPTTDGVADASFVANTDHDSDSYYRVKLQVSDSKGVTASKTVEIRPETSGLQLLSSPTGAPVTYGGSAHTAPYSRRSTVGLTTSIGAAASFTSGGVTYVFDRWSDGGTRQHDITIGAEDRQLTAHYVMDPNSEVEKATGATASASSTKAPKNGETYEPAKALDRNAATRWSSAWGVDGQHWQVDLGSSRQVSKVIVDWFSSYATRYVISTSTDGTNFTQAADVTNSSSGRKTTTFTTRSARYVRITGITRAVAQYGISFNEVEVWGPPDTGTPPPPPPPPPDEIEKAVGGTASASSTKAPKNGETYEPAKALDRSTTTRWSSAWGVDGQHWQVDLGSSRQVSKVVIDWFSSYATRYLISTSTDGTTFTQAADVTNSSSGRKTTTFATRSARYVRITGVTRAVAQYGISFNEAEVWGPPDTLTPEVEKAAGGIASASSTKAPKNGETYEPALALDGDSTTRWSSAWGVDGQHWQVDLGASRQVGRVAINWFSSYATRYTISTSANGVNFTQVADVTNSAPGPKSTTFTTHAARYVRITGVTRAVAQYGISFFDAQVFGPPDP